MEFESLFFTTMQGVFPVKKYERLNYVEQSTYMEKELKNVIHIRDFFVDKKVDKEDHDKSADREKKDDDDWIKCRIELWGDDDFEFLNRIREYRAKGNVFDNYRQFMADENKIWS